MVEELITGRDNLWLAVEKKPEGDGLEVTFRAKGAGPYVLHWAFASRTRGPWQAPPQPLWPSETKSAGRTAAQTPFQSDGNEHQLVFHLDPRVPAPYLVFDLFSPETNRWENNQGKDFYLPLSELKPPTPQPAEVMEEELAGTEAAFRKDISLDSDAEIAVAVTRQGDQLELLVLTDAAGPLMLHWGLAERARSQWRVPPENLQPAGTVAFGDTSVETPFTETGGLRRLKLSFPESEAPNGLTFVLHQTETDQWLKHRGRDLFVPLRQRREGEGALPALAEEIIEGETGPHGWTLMHRFNLCHDLIDEAKGDREKWAVLFVWLRYSSVRQLDWQRNYNTKPRELAHAQDRLTHKLADCYIGESTSRDLIRLMFTCIGRGGEGQRIRDEILQIMHRHHLKEVGGTWMEQWHQKLHNNTTPDDIVICEAFLAFLESHGDVNRYYEALTAGGVTKERLAEFERPINREPEWHPHLRDGLLHDFGNYLKLLKSVHSGTDLETAINRGAHLLYGAARDAVGFVRGNFGNAEIPVAEIGGKITEARRGLRGVLESERDAGRLKEALYLDLALEEALRTVIERRIHAGFNGEQLMRLIGLALENLLLFADDPELAQCRREWQRLPNEDQFSPDWSLHAKAALDRLRFVTGNSIDGLYRLLQPRAEALGNAFGADEWAVRLFSEEVVRGRPVFVLSMLMHHLDPVLRKSAKLGDWQVISPSQAIGRVAVIDSLRSIQGKTFEEPTIIVAEQVFGDEEPPEGVRAVITPRSVDLVSHVAVRARNAGLLFATCFDSKAFARLCSLKGQMAELTVSAGGDVLFAESAARPKSANKAAAVTTFKASGFKPGLRVLRMRDFERNLVGGKSWHLKELAEKLSDGLPTPRSVALPFGVFDAVLESKENTAVAVQYHELVARLGEQPEHRLAELRNCVLNLQLPDSLLADLQIALKGEGLSRAEKGGLAATRIKQVWASKWNDRAYFSRRARHWPHEGVSMAVLIQEVVEAEYAFVIHTVNPFTGDRNEIYTEMVCGLGETLVGNYPGRAFSFVSSKGKPGHTILAYPAKSIGLYGGGLIFRSDSNAEDLAGYAGAGLYDSLLLEEPREAILDYTGDRLVWDEKFREEMLQRITRIGVAVESAFSSAQDIEGAISQNRVFVVQTRPQVGLNDE